MLGLIQLSLRGSRILSYRVGTDASLTIGKRTQQRSVMEGYFSAAVQGTESELRI